MGYVPPNQPPQLNLDRFGMPKDFATYMWVVYGRHVPDKSPSRMAFLHGPKSEISFGLQWSVR